MRRILHLLTQCVLGYARDWRDTRRVRARDQAALGQLQAAASAMSAECLADVRSLADWEARRPVIRRQVLEMLGLDPLPAKSPLNAHINGTVEHAGCRVEKLVFESLPGLYVTANLYLPLAPAGPLPCVMYLCGHLHHPLGAKTRYQDRCWWYARHGFACLALDPLELGEVPGLHHGTHCLNRWHWLSLGYTPAGVEVWNGVRALDWLATRPDVDARRIGTTGVSGGGAISWFLTALDDRIAATAPTCSTYTIGNQVTANLLPWQCDCVYYHNTHRLDFPAVAALVAPRPLLILSGRRDPIFPPGRVS